jgi:hypothetical protein
MEIVDWFTSDVRNLQTQTGTSSVCCPENLHFIPGHRVREKLRTSRGRETQTNIFFQGQTREAIRNLYKVLVGKDHEEIKNYVDDNKVNFRDIICGDKI